VHGVPNVASGARDSLGTAMQTARSLGSTDAAQRITDAARGAFIHGLRLASLVAFVVALVGAAVAWRMLPGGLALTGPEPVASSVTGPSEEAA
jgi:DHA2 family multidrug resistance protein-like MFS transporter